MNNRIDVLEQELAAAAQRLSEARRSQPPERMAVEDATFDTLDGPRKLHELFGGRDELLMIHNMGRRCDYCTLWADAINGIADHLMSRCTVVLVSPDEPAVQREFASARGWRFGLATYRSPDFARSVGFADAHDSYLPGVSAFRLEADGSIVRTGRATFGPLDQFCPLWHLLDLLPGGPGGWEPRVRYVATVGS